MSGTKVTRNHRVPWEEQYGYAQAVQKGDLVFISGQISHDEAGNIVGEGDMVAQMRQSYRNAEKLLAEYGATIDDVVDETLYVTDMDAAFEARVAMAAEVFSGTPQLASTIVEIKRLALPPLMVEIRFVARL